ncbi:glycosyltransferase family 2 protein [Patescibacteria group bacterium]|nr:glycosyltransferase family 2 protein [Patescibacteria group bacterium]
MHYKNLSDTRECLKSLQKLDYERFSVIVVNNDVLEHKNAIEAEFGDFVKIIQNKKNLGFAEGNNVGIRSALANNQVDAVLLLNNDTIVEPNFLKEMISTNADMVAPRMMQYHYRDKIDNLGIVLMSSGLPFNRTNENQKLFCASGGCALYSRKLIETVGVFDKKYFAYAEDLDLGWRARNQGFEAGYASKAIVYHKGSAIHGKLSDFVVYHTYRNLLWTQFKNLPLALLLWQSPWFFAGHIFIFFYYIFKGRARKIFKAYVNGIIGALNVFKTRSENLKKKTVSNKTILSWFQTGLFPKSLLR